MPKFYKSRNTQDVYDQMHIVLREPDRRKSENLFEELRRKVRALRPAELCEVSFNGHSLYTDLLFLATRHASGEITIDMSEYHDRCFRMTTLLFNSLTRHATPEVRKAQLQFLIPSDGKGNSILHKLMFWTNHGRVKEYFDFATKMIEAGMIDKDSFIRLLLDNPEGTSALQKVICSGDGDGVNTYLNFIKKDMGKDPIKSKAYGNFLLKHKMKLRNEDEPCTPLFDACGRAETDTARPAMVGGASVRVVTAPKAGCVSNVSAALAYFGALAEAYNEGWIEKPEYAALLTKRKRTGFLTPLQKVADSSYPDVILAYFTALESVLTPIELRAYLFGLNDVLLNQEEFTSLHDVVCHQKNIFLPLYFAFARRVLSKEDFAQLLQQRTKTFQATPLNKALGGTNHIENVNLYFDQIEECLSEDEYVQLIFTKHTKDKYNSLMRALSSGREDIFNRYLRSIKEARKKGWIKPPQFRTLLCDVNVAGYSTLMQGLYASNPRLVEAYFAMVKPELAEDGAISKEDYEQLLCKPNHNKITPFIQAISTGNEEIFDIYCRELQEALENGLVSLISYHDVLTSCDDQQFSPIMAAISTNNVAIVTGCLSVLRDSFEQGRISGEEYAKALLQKSVRGYSPFFDALRAKNPLIFKAYCNNVQRAFNEGIVPPELSTSYSAFLLGQERGNTPLCVALQEGREENMLCYMDSVKMALAAKDITSKDYDKLLSLADESGFTPMELAMQSKRPTMLSTFLDKIKTDYCSIDPKGYCRILTNASDRGYTPLHDVCNSGQFEKFKAFFDIVMDAYGKGKGIMPLDVYHDLLFARTKRSKETFLDKARACFNSTELAHLERYLKQHLTPDYWKELNAARASDETRSGRSLPSSGASASAVEATPASHAQPTQIRILKRPAEKETSVLAAEQSSLDSILREKQDMDERLKRARLELEKSKKAVEQIKVERDAVEREAKHLRSAAQSTRDRAKNQMRHAEATRERVDSHVRQMHGASMRMFDWASAEQRTAQWSQDVAQMNVAIAEARRNQASAAISHAEHLTATAHAASFYAIQQIQNAEALQRQADYQSLLALRDGVKSNISDFLNIRISECQYMRPDGRKIMRDGRKGRMVADLIIPLAILTPMSADEIYGIPGKDTEVNCWAIDFFSGPQDERIRAFNGDESSPECRLFLVAPKHVVIQPGICILYPSHSARDWTIIQGNNIVLKSRECGMQVLPYFPSNIYSEKDGEFIHSIYLNGIHSAWPPALAPTEGLTAATEEGVGGMYMSY